MLGIAQLFPSSGAGDYPCEDISNYCSIYYYKNDEIGRTTDFLETTAISDSNEVVEGPRVIRNFIQLTISNLNIESQKGCFLFLTHYDHPLEYGLRCVDIHKSLVPYITKKILSPKGINKEGMYPNERSIVKKAFTDSLTREDWLDYYHM